MLTQIGKNFWVCRYLEVRP